METGSTTNPKTSKQQQIEEEEELNADQPALCTVIARPHKALINKYQLRTEVVNLKEVNQDDVIPDVRGFQQNVAAETA